jgi:hypothetical protein
MTLLPPSRLDEGAAGERPRRRADYAYNALHLDRILLPRCYQSTPHQGNPGTPG